MTPSDKRLRVLFVDQTAGPGGAELCLADLVTDPALESLVCFFEPGSVAERLESAGIAVHIETLGAVSKLRKNSGAFDLLQKLPGLWRPCQRLVELAKGVDLLYLNTPKALLIGAIAARIAGKPFVFHLHDFLGGGHFSAPNRWLLRVAAGFASRVIANSEASANSLGWKASVQKKRVRVIPNGFDPAQFSAGAMEANAVALFRQKHAPEVKKVAAVFGRISRWKGQDLALRALQRCPGWTLWIVGAPLFTGDDHVFEAELRELAASADLAGRVVFAGFQEDVAPWMLACDLVLHTSTLPEPFGRVLVEAMLYGRPVSAAAGGGAMEIVESGRLGGISAPGDENSLAGILRDFEQNESTWHLRAEEARRVALEKYGLAGVRKRTLEVLREALEK